MQLIWDKSEYTLQWEQLKIVAAPEAYPPFVCQATVEEQDTFLVLGEQTMLEDPGKPLWYLSHKLETIKPKSPGSVVINDRQANRLLAVVIDVDQVPLCRPVWVLLAYHEVMHAVEKRRLTSLALPLLGTEYGKLAEKESIACLRDVLQVTKPETLKNIWLILPPDTDYRCLDDLLP